MAMVPLDYAKLNDTLQLNLRADEIEVTDGLECLMFSAFLWTLESL